MLHKNDIAYLTNKRVQIFLNTQLKGLELMSLEEPEQREAVAEILDGEWSPFFDRYQKSPRENILMYTRTKKGFNFRKVSWELPNLSREFYGEEVYSFDFDRAATFGDFVAVHGSPASGHEMTKLTAAVKNIKPSAQVAFIRESSGLYVSTRYASKKVVENIFVPMEVIDAYLRKSA